MIGIGIETSCDETGVAVLEGNSNLLANQLFSQIDLHSAYGGVIPEFASRAHLQKLPFLINEAISAMPKGSKPDYIAVTARPGLVGSLLMGYQAALALSKKFNSPLIPIHHLEAHFHAIQLEGHQLRHPYLGVLLSGGNSSFYWGHELGNLEVICETMDDAFGEALDKAASLLGLPYPGGPQIEKAANQWLESPQFSNENPLPEILKGKPKSEMKISFSGIKTSLLYYLRKNPEANVNFLAWAFQARLINLIIRNLKTAIEQYKPKQIIAAGGVTANQTLKQKMTDLCNKFGVNLIVPSPQFCTDNGAMIAACGAQYFQKGKWPQIDSVSSDTSFWKNS